MIAEDSLEDQILEMNKKKNHRELSINITEHAYERAKERLSLNRSSFEHLAEKSYNNGVSHSETIGNLNKYISGLYFEYKSANNIKIYGENVFLFRGNTLITVYRVSNNLIKSALKAQKRK